MIDFQAIFIRDVAELNQINFIAVLRVECENTAGLSDVLVNGLSSKYITGLDGKTAFVHLPEGVPQDGVYDIKLKIDQTVNGVTTTTTKDVDLGEGYLDMDAPARLDTLSGNATAVSFYTGVLQLRGDDFSTTQRVKVNNTDVPFSVISKNEIMCNLPDRASTIDSVDVITSSKTINRRTYFEYMVGEKPSAVTGMQKLIQQFVKLLMTSRGSDLLRPNTGADMQKFVGTNFASDNASPVVAQVTYKVVTCGMEMTLLQTAGGVPADERLSDVQVLGVTVDPEDPTIMQLSLRLNTFGGRSAQFQTMLGSATDYIVGEAKDKLSSVSGY